MVPDFEQHLPGMAAGSGSVEVGAAVPVADAPAGRPPPTPAVVPRVPAEAGVVWPEHGRISYHANKDAFEAHCRHHPQSVLSRTARGKRNKDGLVAGRPLGFMSKWLQWGADCPSKKDHWNAAEWARLFTHEERENARASLYLLRGAEHLFAKERMKEDGESEEPLLLTGLL